MQPEISPPDNQALTKDHYIALAPTFLAFVVVFIAGSAWFAELGGSTRLANQLGFTFCGLMMLATIYSLVSYFRLDTHCRRMRVLAMWNGFLLCLSTISWLILLNYPI